MCGHDTPRTLTPHSTAVSPGVDPILAAEGVLGRQPAVAELQGREAGFVQAGHSPMSEGDSITGGGVHRAEIRRHCVGF